MCDWNQDYLPTHRETEQSSEIHIIFCVWIKPKQTKKGGKKSTRPSCRDGNLGLLWNPKLIWKRVFTPVFEVAFRSVCAGSRSSLFRRMLQGCCSAPGTERCTTFSIGSGEYSERIFLLCSLGKNVEKSLCVTFFFLHMLLCLYHLYHCRCLTITQTWEFPKCFLFFLHLNFLVTLWKPNSSESPSFCWRLLPLSWGEVEWWALDLRPLSAGV